MIQRVEDLETSYRSVASADARKSVVGMTTSTQRFALPTLTEYRAALNEGTDSQGGYTVLQQQMAQFYDMLRSASVVLKAGPRVVDMNSEAARIPRIATTTSTGWFNEGATLSSTEMTFGQVLLTSRKLAAWSLVSNEALADSTPAIRDIIAFDFAKRWLSAWTRLSCKAAALRLSLAG